MAKVLYERDGRIARVTLNRPDVLNAIDDDLPRELAAAVERADADEAVHRLGPEKAKRMLFTGDKIDGREAEKLGLVLKAVPADRLDEEVDALAHRIATVRRNP